MASAGASPPDTAHPVHDQNETALTAVQSALCSSHGAEDHIPVWSKLQQLCTAYFLHLFCLTGGALHPN